MTWVRSTKAVYVGYALPIVEILIGLLLVLGLPTCESAAVGGLLMLAFIIGISSAWARGLALDCGCFGGGGTMAASQTQYPKDILRDASPPAPPGSSFVLDHRLFG